MRFDKLDRIAAAAARLMKLDKLDKFDRFDKLVAAATVLLILAIAGYVGIKSIGATAADAPQKQTTAQAAAAPQGEPSVELTDDQAKSITVEPVSERVFPLEKESFGSIDFNEDMAVQVFTPYQGRILQAFPVLGDEVKEGQILFTIESPDLIQAESTLIAAAGVLDLTTRALVRAKDLYEKQALAQKDYEQAVSDQQTAEGALRAARDAVRIFGKTDAEIDRMIAQRRTDNSLVVPSPISGVVTARNAQPGLFVQPGNPPAPYIVADISTVWMLANVNESDAALYHVGQEVKVSVMTFPGRVFTGKISRIATAVDPNIHRLLVRSEVGDPQRELRPGMFASFVISTGAPIRALAAPLEGVIRQGDGTMTVWVTTDRHHFTQRVVKIGLEKDGYRQIVEGLRPGELVAAKGALLLDNIVNNVGAAT
jgi:membrane fusion protein, heavy metal efflux system